MAVPARVIEQKGDADSVVGIIAHGWFVQLPEHLRCPASHPAGLHIAAGAWQHIPHKLMDGQVGEAKAKAALGLMVQQFVG